MKFTNFEIVRKKDASFFTNITPNHNFETITMGNYPTLHTNLTNLYTLVLANRQLTSDDKDKVLSSLNADFFETIWHWDSTTLEKETVKTAEDSVKALIKFFTEFDFCPNFRFLNTMLQQGSAENAETYIFNYFNLTNSPYTPVIQSKMESPEFKTLISDLFTLVSTDKKINSRLKLYYGTQGTGKTTKALVETDSRCMVCHSAMLPNDLMEDFTFNDGKATFQPSALALAMMNGNKITLDEINLLPFESLRFLQGILDGKKSFEYKGITINIADGFEIIGTMNLTVNGMTYGLPEPLVDRCSDIKEFVLTPADLLNAL